MHRRHMYSWACATMFGVGVTGVYLRHSNVAYAKPVASGKSGQNANLKLDIRISPERLHWGLSLQQVAKIYDDEFDVQYRSVYQRTDPGVDMQSLDAEVNERKALIRRTRVDFGLTPTGVNQGPLKGEYSYNNGESMARTQLAGGTQRFFFFFNDKLWKVYDEYKLGSKLGTSWSSAVAALTEMLGGEPKTQPADPQQGRSFDEAIWTTPAMQIRAINREYQKIVAVAYADRSIQDDLASHRPNRLGNASAVSSEVRDATTHEPVDTGTKGSKSKGGKKK